MTEFGQVDKILGPIRITDKGQQGHPVLLNQMAQQEVAAHFGIGIQRIG